MLKLLWSKRLVWNAHIHKSLNEAQAGSRPEHRCIDVVLRKTMNYLHATLTRTPLITIDNDAKACYDRILCNLAMIVSRYYGMTSAACRFHATTLKNMQFSIRTSAGDSNATYRHTNDTPIHGTGQGSCASPSIWLVLSTILLECHLNIANGMTHHNIHPSMPSKSISAEAFVDDTAAFINFKQFPITLSTVEDIIRLIHVAKQDFDLWQILLDAAGGKLELAKCFWYLLCLYFNNMGDPVPMTLAEIQAIIDEQITVQDLDTKVTTLLEQKDVHESHRTLGAHKCIFGKETQQYNVLLEKSNSLAISTRLGQLSRFQARRAFTSIYVPSMTYSLVSTNLSKVELKAIQSKAIQAFLPAMGFERTFPHAVVFASRTMGGLNIGDLYTECGIAKTGAVISHIRANTGLGQIIQINLNWLQLQVGTSIPVLQLGTSVNFLPTNWFTHLQEFLLSFQGQIEVTDQWCPRLERVGDQNLMDKFIQVGLSKRELRICNNWRLYFQALTLADITTPDGRHIQDCYWVKSVVFNEYKHLLRHSKLRWPIQMRPDHKTFSIWKNFLRKAFHLTSAPQLPVPLGIWNVSPTESNSRWNFYFQPYSRLLYHTISEGEYEIHKLAEIQSDRYSSVIKFEAVPDDTCTSLPSHCFPVSPRVEYQTLRIQHAQYYCPWAFSNPRSSVRPTNFEEHIAQLPSWKQQLLLHWESVETEQLLNFLSNEQMIYVASDGGFDLEAGTGTFGGVIADDCHLIASVGGTAPGRSDIHCSFRSEHYGLLAACSFINELFAYFRIQGTYIEDGKQKSRKIVTWLDSKSVIARVTKHRQYDPQLGDMMDADMDLELQTLGEIKAIEARGFEFCPLQYVKAHQDDNKSYSDLSRDAQLNVEADKLATEFTTNQCIKQQYFPPSAAKASLYIESNAITSKYKECIRHAVHRPALIQYIKHKWDWKDSTTEDIWWDVHGSALKRLSHSDRQKIQKFNYYHLPTNRRLSKFNPAIENHCDKCPTIEETDDHIIWCNSTERIIAKQKWEEDMYHYLSETHTPTMVRDLIYLAFHHWIYNKNIDDIENHLLQYPAELQEAYNAQTIIGWNHFFRGRLSLKWKSIIMKHLSTSGTKTKLVRTSQAWASGLIVAIWHGVLIMWDLRNDSVHGPNRSNQSAAEKRRLLKEAAWILEQAHNYQHFHFEWFTKSLEELEKYSVISLKAWVRNARTMVRLHRLELQQTIVEDNDMEGDGLSNVNSVDLLGEMEEEEGISSGS